MVMAFMLSPVVTISTQRNHCYRPSIYSNWANTTNSICCKQVSSPVPRPYPTPKTKSSSIPPSKRPYGYWKHLPNIIHELNLYLEQYPSTSMPTAADLEAANRRDLAGAIRRHGGWSVIANAANLIPSAYTRPRSLYLTFCTKIRTPRMRPHGYWLQWSNLKNELSDIIQKEGKVPSARAMERIGRSDISRAVRHHGGWRVVRQKLRQEGVLHDTNPRTQIVDINSTSTFSQWTYTRLHTVLDTIAVSTGKRSGQLPSFRDIEQFAKPDFRTTLEQFGGLESINNARKDAVDVVKRISVTKLMPTYTEIRAKGGPTAVEIVRRGGGTRIVAKSAQLNLRRKLKS